MTTQTITPATWTPFSYGAILTFPYYANADQLKTGSLARVNASQGSFVLIEEVVISEGYAVINFRHVDNETGALGEKMVGISRRKLGDTGRPFWSFEPYSITFNR